MQCPICSGPMWDNRARKRNPKAPDYKCKDPNCPGVIWPQQPAAQRPALQHHPAATSTRAPRPAPAAAPTRPATPTAAAPRPSIEQVRDAWMDTVLWVLDNPVALCQERGVTVDLSGLNAMCFSVFAAAHKLTDRERWAIQPSPMIPDDDPPPFDDEAPDDLPF